MGVTKVMYDVMWFDERENQWRGPMISFRTPEEARQYAEKKSKEVPYPNKRGYDHKVVRVETTYDDVDVFPFKDK